MQATIAVRRLLRDIYLVTVTLLLAGAHALAEPLPLEYFTRDDTMGSLHISPEGDFLAATAKPSGTSALLFFEIESMEPIGGVRAREGDLVTRVHWVSNSRVVHSYAQRFPGQDYASDTGEIFAINRDGKSATALYGYRAGERQTGTRVSRREATSAIGEFLDPLWEDEKSILIIERPYRVSSRVLRFNADAHPKILRLDVRSGKKTTVASVPLALASVVLDREANVRFAMGYETGASYTALWKPEPGDDWTRFELPGFRDDSVYAHRFDAHGGGVLFTAVDEDDSIDSLYRLDFASGEVERLYRHDEAPIEGVVTDLVGDSIIGVTVYTDRLEYHWIASEDDPAVRLYRMLEKAFAGQSFRIASVDRHGRRAIVYVFSDVNPGDFYLFDTETMHAQFLQSSEPWVDPELMRPKEPVELSARDGLRLRGYLTRPRDEAGPFPLIVLPHGGPHGIRDRWDYDWEVQLLANRGYAVLQVNFRGSGGSGINFERAGYGEWGAAMQDDITDATLWAIEEGIASADRICIFGTSYGGYAALMGTVREPQLYRCAIANAGVYDLELMFKAGDTQRWRVGQALLDRFLGNDAELLKQRSPVHNAGKIEVPVLLIHGKDDERADYEHAKRMKKALEDADKPFEWVVLSREGHGLFDQETRKEVYERILDFLGTHLPVDDRAAAASAGAYTD